VTEAHARTFSLRDIESMLGLSRAVIAGLVAHGFVTPARGAKREYRFTFQDVVLLRTAHTLQAARIPPRKIVRALARLRATLPADLPLTGLRITAVGSEVAVREGGAQWQADSGQMLMDFELLPNPPQGRAAAVSLRVRESAAEWFARGAASETQGDAKQAERAYRRALELEPGHVDAVLNLGVLLCDSGRCADAVALNRAALAQHPREPLLHYNLAIALEDAGEPDAALAAYEHCLKLQPDLADAHFNAARLHEQLGHATKAIRHYSAYRRLQR
jgi:tetratricopeptide (TPR) repeat protein